MKLSKSWGIIIGALFLLVGLECLARFCLGLGDPPLSIPDEKVDYLFAPNQVCHRFGNLIIYNNVSMRCDYDVKDKDLKGGGLMVIGDSVINGGALTDHSCLATTILGSRLGCKVANVSAGSWGPGNYAAYLQKFGSFGAEYLVVEMNSHDVWEDDPTLSSGANVGVDLSLPDRKPWCATYELLCRYVWPRLSKAMGVGKVKVNKVDVARWNNDNQNSAQYNLRQLDYIFTTPPKNKSLLIWRSRLETINNSESEGERIIRQWATSNHVEVISVRAEEGDYRDGIHPNLEGQKKMASALEAWYIRKSLEGGSLKNEGSE